MATRLAEEGVRYADVSTAVPITLPSHSTIFTGRYPRGLFDYVVGVTRWGLRVSAYFLMMVDKYPPFSLGEDDPRL